MRIVHVAPSYHPILGGAEGYLKAVSEGLVRRGHEVLVITQRKTAGFAGRVPPRLPRHEVVGGVHVHRLRPDRVTPAVVERAVRWPGGYRLGRAALSEAGLRDPQRWSMGFRARRAIRRFRADVVGVSNWYFAALPAGVAARGPRRRFALVGIPLFHTEERWSLNPGYADLIRRYDALLVNTEHERRFVEALAPAGPSATVTGVGIDPAAFAHRDAAGLRARLGIGDAPLVGFLGRLDPTKGVVALIEAMPIVWKTCPEARLLLAGRAFHGGTKAHDAIAGALSRLAPDARRRVIQVEDLDDRDKGSFFDALDVYAMPSLAESFGIAYLEAWLARKPVIGADAGSTPFVIRDGVDGLLVDPRDPGAIGHAIVALLADPPRRVRMGQAGHDRTVAERTWARVTEAVESVYVSLADARRRRAMLPPP